MQLSQIGTSKRSPNPVVRSWALHTQTVHALVALDDGTVLSSSEDGTVKRWVLDTGEVLAQVEGHAGPVNHMARRGKWLATAGDDTTARLWRIDDQGMHPHFVLGGHEHYVRQVALTERFVVTACQDKLVRVFSMENGRLVHELEGHQASVQSVGTSPDGRYAVTAALDHGVFVWDLDTGEPMEPLYNGEGIVRDLGLGGMFSGVYFATQNQSGVGHRGQTPGRILFLSDNELLTASDGMIAWDFAARREQRTLTDLGWPIAAVAADRRRLFFGTHTEIRGVLRHDWHQIVFRHGAPNRGVRSMALAGSPQGERLVVGSQSGEVQVIDVGGWFAEPRHLTRALNVAVSPQGAVAATVDADNVVRLWDMATGEHRGACTRQREPNTKPFAFSADGARLATTRSDGAPAVCIWDTATGALLHEIDPTDAEGNTYRVHSIVFAWDGVLVGPAGTGAIEWWSLDGTRRVPMQGDTQQVSQLALVGQGLMSVGYFKTTGDHDDDGSARSVSQLQAWDLRQQRLLWTRAAQKAPGARYAAQFGDLVPLPNGRLLTGTGASSQQLGVYDVLHHEVVVRFDLEATIQQTAVVPDGRFVVTTHHEEQGRALVWLYPHGEIEQRVALPEGAGAVAMAPRPALMAWPQGDELVVADLGTARERVRQPAPAGRVASLAFDPMGERLVVGGVDGRVTVYAIEA